MVTKTNQEYPAASKRAIHSQIMALESTGNLHKGGVKGYVHPCLIPHTMKCASMFSRMRKLISWVDKKAIFTKLPHHKFWKSKAFTETCVTPSGHVSQQKPETMASRSPEDVGLLNGASSNTCQGGEEVQQEMSLKDAFLAHSLRLVSSCRLYFLSHPLLGN